MENLLWWYSTLFHYYNDIHIISLLTERYELNKLISLSMYGFIAQLVEQRTGICDHGFESCWNPEISGFFFPVA